MARARHEATISVLTPFKRIAKRECNLATSAIRCVHLGVATQGVKALRGRGMVA